MRRWSLAMVFIVLAVGCGDDKSPTSPSGPNSIAGNWSGTATSNLGGLRFNLSTSLTQSGTSVGGTLNCTPATAPCSFTTATVSGTLNGSSLSAQVKAQNGTVLCGSFQGTVSGNSMSGTYACTTGDTGTWGLNKN